MGVQMLIGGPVWGDRSPVGGIWASAFDLGMLWGAGVVLGPKHTNLQPAAAAEKNMHESEARRGAETKHTTL